ncbi:MAG TPA: transposase [Candidatus Elarobacter sp.]|nr:transposase [Candidatus Elarobacter sp.]
MTGVARATCDGPLSQFPSGDQPMSSESAPESALAAVRSMIYLGMDGHKDSIPIAVLPAAAKTPTRLDRLASDLPKLKRWTDRVARDGELRIWYEASGAGYVLHRAIQAWGYAYEVIAPSLIPKRPGVQRKHDTRDAADLARLYRAGELVAVRIPTESDERVRDVVRCRETFQREILKSRHDLSATEARVSRHRCAAERGQDALGHDRLEHEKQERTEKQGGGKEGRHDAAVRQGRRRGRGSDGGLTGHGCARAAEIAGRIVFRGHPLPCRNACVKY